MHSYVRQVTGYRPSTCKPLDNVDYMPKTPRGPVASHLVCPFLRWPSTAFHTCTHDVRGARSSTKHEWRPAGGVHTMTRVIENTNDFVITQCCNGGGQARRCLISSHLISSWCLFIAPAQLTLETQGQVVSTIWTPLTNAGMQTNYENDDGDSIQRIWFW